MDLSRGTLARLDRKLLAEFDQDEQFRMVRVPVSEAKWSTWKRYCDSAGVSMGRAISAMIDHELAGVIGDSAGELPPMFTPKAEEELARREDQVARREQYVTAADDRLGAWYEHLQRWEGELEAREHRAELGARMSAGLDGAPIKVGRNERCPCLSGLKYKRCHGVVGR